MNRFIVPAWALAAALLVACSSAPAPITPPTGDPQADVQAWETEIGTDVAYAQAQATSSIGKGISAAITAGKAACGAASELDGLYNAPLTQIGGTVIAVALGNGAAMAAADATEAAIYQGKVKPDCVLLDAMDPANPAADALSIAQEVMRAVPQLQAALTQAAPQVAVAVSVGAAATMPATPAPASGK